MPIDMDFAICCDEIGPRAVVAGTGEGPGTHIPALIVLALLMVPMTAPAAAEPEWTRVLPVQGSELLRFPQAIPLPDGGYRLVGTSGVDGWVAVPETMQ